MLCWYLGGLASSRSHPRRHPPYFLLDWVNVCNDYMRAHRRACVNRADREIKKLTRCRDGEEELQSYAMSEASRKQRTQMMDVCRRCRECDCMSTSDGNCIRRMATNTWQLQSIGFMCAAVLANVPCTQGH